ncbi:hypothetical protein ACFFWC_28125 [Plantactinospora siamensis]|uniref:Outer membrane channel protein CpnT-like N-terminal domain-containing protein n=1 Tax=Plantactinospora siamensis TaxID=555372 RepID=A0ABV6NQC5_9ACTN
MTDNYYGYQQVTLPGYAGAADDYAYKPSGDTNNYSPTNWAGTNIEAMWAMIQKESDEMTMAMAETWRRTAVLLQSTRDNLQRHADALNKKWTSPAGQVFMTKVGASLHSYDEWHKVASDNASGLEQLAKKIKQTQQDFKPLWEEYQRTQTSEAQKRKDDKGFQAIDLVDSWVPGVDGNNGKSYEDVQKDFHQRAVNIMKPLADTYIDVYISNISRGGKYKGPVVFPKINPGNVPTPGRPPAPGRPPGPGSGPGAPPSRPNAPGRPTTTDHPNAPAPPPVGTHSPVGTHGPGAAARDPGITLAGGAAPLAPPPPAPTGTPPAPPPSAPGALPPAPLPPGLGPGGTGPGRPTLSGTGGRGQAPSRPGLNPEGTGRGPAPGRPTLPGAKNGLGRPGAPGSEPPPGGRGRAPGRPTLPGSKGGPGTSRPGSPGLGKGTARGAGPGNPRLPGSTNRTGRPGAPGEGPEPQSRASRPSLGGKRAPGRPGLESERPGRRPGAPGVPEETPGRPGAARAGGAPGENPTSARPGRPGGAPGENPMSARPGRPGLTGRTGPGGGRPAPTTGPEPALGGRRAGSGGTGLPGPRRDKRSEEKPETWEYGDGDDELWRTESTAVGDLDAPAEHRPQEQGKALGQS